MDRIAPFLRTLICGWMLAVGAGAAIPSKCACGQDVEAIPGEPFGVASIVVRLDRVPVADVEYFEPEIVGPPGRVFYPAIVKGRLRELLGITGPLRQLRLWFLFKGTAPFDVTVYTPVPVKYRVVPQPPRRRRDESRLWTQWWRNYHSTIRLARQAGDYPPLVQSYLVTMLGRRLRLEPPLAERRKPPPPDQFQHMLQLLAGTESMHDQMLRAVSSGEGLDREPPRWPLPPQPRWTEYVFPQLENPPAIEPLASHVPQHCFYIRYGSYGNYLWLDKLTREFGGDLARMITLRGYSPQHSARIQDQLALEQSALSDLLGGQVISDVALIGGDLFIEDGSAIGMLFEAKNFLLGRDLAGQQKSAYNREKDAGATLTKVQIAGHEVSLLATPDNRLRSFYAVDGKYHLVANSRWLVEEFYRAAESNTSLADSAEFQFARAEMPVERNDTVFAFFPTAFFQRLLSPQYQIELRRRLRAVTDIELVMMAQLAAKNEGQPHDTVADLMAGGFLPQGFLQRADGGGPVLASGKVIDSVRGARGTFLPIPDMKIEAVTTKERQQYESQLASLQSQLTQLVPLTAGVQRYQLKDDPSIERIVIDAQLSPFDPEQFGWLVALLGDPLPHRVVVPAGTVISAQASVRGGLLSPQVPPHIMFFGVYDTVPAGDVRSAGVFEWLRILQQLPGYLGAWPAAGFLDLLPIPLGTEPDALGYSRYPFGLWRRQFQGFSVLSFQRPVLEYVTPRLRVTDDDEPAHLRISMSNLSETQLEAYLNELSFQRAKQASMGNARLMQLLVQQLGVPREQALAEVERLLNAKLVCSLGGSYKLSAIDSGLPQWQSDKWSARTAAAAQYKAPWMDWFRGGQGRMVRSSDRILAHGELNMKRTAKGSGLPFFDLLK